MKLVKITKDDIRGKVLEGFWQSIWSYYIPIFARNYAWDSMEKMGLSKIPNLLTRQWETRK